MVCIFPKDETTDFLLPLYDKLCSLGFKGLHVDTNDNIEQVLEAIEKAKVVVFLGHGTSYSLMGTPFNGDKTNIIHKDNISILKDKRMFLLSCRSAEFCETYNLYPSIGFGMMPTGLEDVHSMIDEDVNFPALKQQDIDVYNKALINAISSAFNSGSMDKMEDLYNKVKLYANIEITNCLLQKNTPMFREVADLIQDMKNECTIFKQQV